VLDEQAHSVMLKPTVAATTSRVGLTGPYSFKYDHVLPVSCGQARVFDTVGRQVYRRRYQAPTCPTILMPTNTYLMLLTPLHSNAPTRQPAAEAGLRQGASSSNPSNT
jgi:hypothetical protein